MAPIGKIAYVAKSCVPYVTNNSNSLFYDISTRMKKRPILRKGLTVVLLVKYVKRTPAFEQSCAIYQQSSTCVKNARKCLFSWKCDKVQRRWYLSSSERGCLLMLLELKAVRYLRFPLPASLSFFIIYGNLFKLYNSQKQKFESVF